MNKRKKRISRNLGIILASVGMMFSPSATYQLAYAESNQGAATATILPGALTLAISEIPTNFTLNERGTVATGSAGTLVVTDATGSGAGWHVAVEGSPVIETKEDGTRRTLPDASSSLHKGGAKITSNGGMLPHFFESDYIGLNASEQQNVLTAYPLEGMGQFQITFAEDSLRLYLSDYNETSTYSITLTWSITQGP